MLGEPDIEGIPLRDFTTLGVGVGGEGVRARCFLGCLFTCPCLDGAQLGHLWWRHALDSGTDSAGRDEG